MKTRAFVFIPKDIPKLNVSFESINLIRGKRTK